jgi:hypothetical protein
LFILVLHNQPPIQLQRQRDKENAEKAKYEVYSPVPPIICRQNNADHHRCLIFLTAKTWISGVLKDPIQPGGAGRYDHIVTVDKSKGIMARQRFLDYQLHLEFQF